VASLESNHDVVELAGNVLVIMAENTLLNIPSAGEAFLLPN
jgi:hypothetical protein